MNLDLSQTLELYTSYIQYRYYLSSVLGMPPSLFTFHYPLRCSESNSVANHNMGSAGSINIGTKETASVNYPTPVTPQQTAMCQASNKRKGPNLIYSEEIDHPLKALRYLFGTFLWIEMFFYKNDTMNENLLYATFLWHYVVLIILFCTAEFKIIYMLGWTSRPTAIITTTFRYYFNAYSFVVLSKALLLLGIVVNTSKSFTFQQY